jgi:hypothetical protein
MNTKSLIRACTDVHRIGKMAYIARRYCLKKLLEKTLAVQRYQHRFGIHTFYLITNNSNIAWLINVSDIYLGRNQVGGFMQVIDKTFVLAMDDFALVPSFMYPRNDDFSFLSLQFMFMWMSSYPDLIANYGLRPVPVEIQEPEYINVQTFFKDFMIE